VGGKMTPQSTFASVSLKPYIVQDAEGYFVMGRPRTPKNL